VGEALAAFAGLAGAGRRGAGLTFTPALEEPTRCTTPTALTVPLRAGGARLRPGRAVLASVGKASGRGADADRVKLVCVPAP
jgi:hypothetical protein